MYALQCLTGKVDNNNNNVLLLYSLKPAGRQVTDVASNAGVPLSNMSQPRQQAQSSLDQQIAVIKRQHEEELAKLRKTFEEELAKERDTLRSEKDAKIASYKNELSTQLVISINVCIFNHIYK